MRRLIVLAVMSLLLSLGTTPARAQGVFYEVDLGRAAVAFWDSPKTETFAFALAGQGIIYNSDVGQPYIGEVGCAAVQGPHKAAFGCGELSAFSIDDDLGAAMGAGTFDAHIYDFRSGKVVQKGKISFRAAWKATDGPAPRGGGGFWFDEGPSAGFGMGAEIGRYAFAGKGSRVTASPVGRGPMYSAFGDILAGPQINFEVHP